MLDEWEVHSYATIPSPCKTKSSPVLMIIFLTSTFNSGSLTKRWFKERKFYGVPHQVLKDSKPNKTRQILLPFFPPFLPLFLPPSLFIYFPFLSLPSNFIFLWIFHYPHIHVFIEPLIVSTLTWDILCSKEKVELLQKLSNNQEVQLAHTQSLLH